jgi:hypothetical protein
VQGVWSLFTSFFVLDSGFGGLVGFLFFYCFEFWLGKVKGGASLC